MFRIRIRQWLGVTDIQDYQHYLGIRIEHLNAKVAGGNEMLQCITPGLSRVIAKLDANYAKDELDPAKRAESQRIADEVLKRLEGEAKARLPYNIDHDHFE